VEILVYGAGVLGSLYGARLREAGHSVTLLARGQRLAELRQYGIVLEEGESGRRTATKVRVVETLGTDDPYDLVLVIMRKNQVSGVLPSIAANRRTPNVLFMVNNAEGPGPFVEALGHERVLLGFPGAGGGREGHVIKYHVVSGGTQKTTLGEVDGSVTPRLQQIAATFHAAGFPVEISRNIDAWLKTHVALVSPIANAIYMADGDSYKLAKMREGLVFNVRAIKEGFGVLHKLGVPVTPAKMRVLELLPEWILVAFLSRIYQTSWAEVVMARHANVARDEMKQLADEFRQLCKQAAVPTPAIDRLNAYI
jgi:2-dehydropantoate 2-reductase